MFHYVFYLQKRFHAQVKPTPNHVLGTIWRCEALKLVEVWILEEKQTQLQVAIHNGGPHGGSWDRFVPIMRALRLPRLFLDAWSLVCFIGDTNLMGTFRFGF